MENLWNRELVIETIENLSQSQGFYGRLLSNLEDMQERDPDQYEEVMNALVEAGGPVEMVMAIEG